MTNKFWFLTKNSLQKKMKNKTFIIVNILLLIVLVALINIDRVVMLFGGNFDKQNNIMVLDNTNKTYEIFKNDIEKCMPYAIAIEMVHNFSLIHDDLPGIDNDDFRHGKLTNHKKFNEATAILAGDALLNGAYSVISKDLQQTKIEEVSNKLKILGEFSNAVDRMIAGEYVDTEYEGKEISEEDLNYIHQNKTGELLKLPVRMGAILAGAKEEDIQNLTQYAEKIGLAFQIKDDILSEEGNEEVLGKPVGNDKKMQKCTYVSKYGLKKSKEILDKIIKEAIAYGVGIINQEEIDRINILNATKKGLTIAIKELEEKLEKQNLKRPEVILVDALTGIDTLGIPYKSIIHGDAISYSIACASIIAKVTRDRIMKQMDEIYPQYGFAKHKGYGTAAHMQAIRENGLCPIHRRSFVKNII